ncbi:helix-turn-helix transcriptional regulator [Natronosalvus hydrolyticus]
MGTSITAMHGTHPVWYLIGTIVAAGVISGLYLGVRDRIVSPNAQVGASDGSDAKTQVEDDALEATQTAKPERPILDFLPDDERRILQPVLASPGLTQIELRDRSDFSKSKVSQTVTDLEKRGLLYREPQGRTYRVYPSDELKHNKSQFFPPD